MNQIRRRSSKDILKWHQNFTSTAYRIQQIANVQISKQPQWIQAGYKIRNYLNFVHEKIPKFINCVQLQNELLIYLSELKGKEETLEHQIKNSDFTDSDGISSPGSQSNSRPSSASHFSPPSFLDGIRGNFNLSNWQKKQLTTSASSVFEFSATFNSADDNTKIENSNENENENKREGIKVQGPQRKKSACIGKRTTPQDFKNEMKNLELILESQYKSSLVIDCQIRPKVVEKKKEVDIIGTGTNSGIETGAASRYVLRRMKC